LGKALWSAANPWAIRFAESITSPASCALNKVDPMELGPAAVTPLSRALGIAFGLATQAAFVVTVWCLFWFLRDSGTNATTSWFAIDTVLALQFAVVHSALLLPPTRYWISRWLDKGLYGSLFCTATCLTLWMLFADWKSSAILEWDLSGGAKDCVRFAFYLSWATLFYSISLTGFGYQTGWTQWRHWFQRKSLPVRNLVEKGALRWMRHPIYLSFLGLIWFTPRMTADRLLLAILWSTYIVVGSCLKDRRLTYYLGDTYRAYASRVPGFPGMFVGPLAKWTSLDDATASPRALPLDSRRAA
jgi:methanethiol S-methyltransferase